MPDEYYASSPVLEAFIAHVLDVVGATPSPPRRVERMRPAFGELLSASNWLPDEFTCAKPNSTMGGGIASYLIYRRADRSLTLHALIVPVGAQTPIHDHLAWGLVRLPCLLSPSTSWAATWGVCCGTHMIFPTGWSMISDPVTPTLNAITAERINVPSRDTGLRHCSRRCTLRRFGPHQTN